MLIEGHGEGVGRDPHRGGTVIARTRPGVADECTAHAVANGSWIHKEHVEFDARIVKRYQLIKTEHSSSIARDEYAIGRKVVFVHRQPNATTLHKGIVIAPMGLGRERKARKRARFADSRPLDDHGRDRGTLSRARSIARAYHSSHARASPTATYARANPLPTEATSHSGDPHAL
jgi:hypothetical protein